MPISTPRITVVKAQIANAINESALKINFSRIKTSANFPHRQLLFSLLTQPEKVQQPVKAHATSGAGLLSSLLVVIVAATVSLALTATVFAQQRVETGPQTQRAIANE
jgi:hypothetical protein